MLLEIGRFSLHFGGVLYLSRMVPYKKEKVVLAQFVYPSFLPLLHH